MVPSYPGPVWPGTPYKTICEQAVGDISSTSSVHSSHHHPVTTASTQGLILDLQLAPAPRFCPRFVPRD